MLPLPKHKPNPPPNFKTLLLTATRHTAGWAKSDIFSRCPNCLAISIHGKCHSCGWLTECCICRRIRSPAGYIKSSALREPMRTSSSICPDCAKPFIPHTFAQLISGFPFKHYPN